MNNYILTANGNFVGEDELYHYGVLGMKWGVKRGHSAKSYEKASRKLNKLDKKVDKKLEKAYAKREKADRKAGSVFASQKSTAKADFKADKAMRKAVLKTRKAQKWLKQMDKVFSDTPESLSAEQIKMGERYTNIMNNRVFR